MKRTVVVTQVVEVELDETKFTPEFMTEFRESFYNFKSLDQHAKHLAQLFARNLDRNFIEGYGEITNFGIRFKMLDTEVDIDE